MKKKPEEISDLNWIQTDDPQRYLCNVLTSRQHSEGADHLVSSFFYVEDKDMKVIIYNLHLESRTNRKFNNN